MPKYVGVYTHPGGDSVEFVIAGNMREATLALSYLCGSEWLLSYGDVGAIDPEEDFHHFGGEEWSDFNVVRITEIEEHYQSAKEVIARCDMKNVAESTFISNGEELP